MRLEDTVADAVLNCPPGTAYLAAVSGGADSVAMLSALAAIRNSGTVFDLRCIHVEHGIRPEPESRGDAEFVKHLCKELHIQCKVVSIKPGRIAAVAKERGIGIEAAARLFRRRAWFREAKRLEALPENPLVRILVAHTVDDALETALMRIFRGAGPSGLAAMPAGRGRILRPLIRLRRSDVIANLAEKKIPWQEDKSNSDIQFLRNRIRHCLVPRLNESFPNWRTTLTAFAETQSLAADFIQNEASARVLWQPLDGSRESALYTDDGLFFDQPVIIREEALFQGIDRLLRQPRLLERLPHNSPARSGTIKRANIRRFCEGEKKAVDLGIMRLRKDSKKIIISKPGQGEYGFSLLINKPGLYILKGTAIEICEIPVNGNEGEGAFLALLPLVLRPGFKEDVVKCPVKFPGDCIVAVDMSGTAACIVQGKLLWRRDSASAMRASETRAAAAALMSTNNSLCMVKITEAGIGGTDA
jgi:tRNA(Ile)-lysidine synthase